MMNCAARFDIASSLKGLGRCLLWVCCVFFLNTAHAEADAIPVQGTLELKRGHSLPFPLDEEVKTIAVGDPNVIEVVTVKPDFLMLNPVEIGTTTMTIFAKSGAIQRYQVRVGLDPALADLEIEKLARDTRLRNSEALAKRKLQFDLEQLTLKQRSDLAEGQVKQLSPIIRAIEKNVTVENLNGVILLKGTVPTAAAHARVLSIADRFVSGGNEPDFKVISDQGGVLAGNLDEKEEFEPVEPRLTTTRLRGAGGSRGGGARRSGSASAALNQTLMDGKGNLAQNIVRGDVIMVADGKVMSLIKVAKQPKVQIQMRIVAVDRNKTDQLGIDWRIDDKSGKVTIFNFLGGVAPSLPRADFSGLFSPGDATMAGFFTPGSYFISAFLRAVEEKGAATVLSEPLLTAISGESASFLVGGSVPIPLQELSAGNATSNAVVATYIDWIEFGLRLIVRPTVLENGKIQIVLDQSMTEPDYAGQVQILGAPIPAFKQKTVSTVTESASGESWAVAGLLAEEQSKNLKKVPWISNVPILGALFRNKEDKVSRNELMIVVTARTIEGVGETTTDFQGQGLLAPARTGRNNDKQPVSAAARQSLGRVEREPEVQK